MFDSALDVVTTGKIEDEVLNEAKQPDSSLDLSSLLAPT